jgi:hypothetical protein
MESVPKDLELLVKQIAAAAEVMHPGLRVTWLPDAAGEQYESANIPRLDRSGEGNELKLHWKAGIA